MNVNAHSANAPDLHESRFINVARPLMIFGLVWHHLFEIPGSTHSPRLSLQGVEHFWPELINTFVHMAMMTAVPLLSVISGFLFFRRPRIDYVRLIANRFRTVALAAWLWSAIWLVVGWLAFNWVRSAGLLGAPGYGWLNYGFDNLTASTVINGIFALTREPFAYQFWFVHDLLVTILLAPLIHYFLRLFGWQLLIGAGLIWLVLPDPPFLFSGNVPMFFAIGAWLSLPDSPSLGGVLAALERNRWRLFGLLAVTLALRVFSHELGTTLDTFLQSHPYLCMLRVFGVLAFGGLISRYVSASGSQYFFERFGCYSFFIFAFHYPLIEVVQIGVLATPGYDTVPGMFLSWLLVPLVTIALSIGAAMAMEAALPALFSLLNGGRGWRETQNRKPKRRALRGFSDLPDPASEPR